MKNYTTTVALENGESFDIIHDFEADFGALNPSLAAVEDWKASTTNFSAESFVAYVKEKQPNRYIITSKEFSDSMRKILHKTRIIIENGDSFDVLSNFKNVGGSFYSFIDEVSAWKKQTSDYSAESFVAYIKEIQPDRVIMTQREYDKWESQEY